MKLTVLGSGVCVPSATRSSPGYHVCIGKKQFLVDSGSGTLHNIAKVGFDYTALDGVFYTHLHVDHTADLIPLLFSLKNDAALFGKKKHMTFYGPIGFKEFLESLINFYETHDQGLAGKFSFDIKELQDQEKVSIDDFTVQAYKVFHTKQSLGFRFTDGKGKVLAFSGDTGPCDNLLELAKDADVAVFECSAPEEFDTDTHLNPTRAGAFAKKAGVKKLILSHIYPITDEIPIEKRCKTEYDGDVVVAQDLMEYEVSDGRKNHFS